MIAQRVEDFLKTWAYRQNLRVLMYHAIGEPTFISPKKFERHVKFVLKNFSTLKPLDFLDELNTRDRKVVFTFDDGYKSAYESASSILEKHGLRGIFFITLGYVGKSNHMNWDEIRDLQKRGHEIGSHTITHPDLTQLEAGRLEYELLESKEILDKKLALDTRFLAFPFGRPGYSKKFWEVISRAGYEHLFAGSVQGGNLCIKRISGDDVKTLRELKFRLENPTLFLLKEQIFCIFRKGPIHV